MSKMWKIFEYGYLIIAVVFIVETVLNWNIDRERAYLFLLFGVLAIFMYFFRRDLFQSSFFILSEKDLELDYKREINNKWNFK